jgi:hypothetical protein
LISGEELLIEKLIVDNNILTLINPYCIVRFLDKNSNVKFQLDKWMPFTASDNFIVDPNHVITYNIPDEELASFYEQIVKSDNEVLDNEYYGQSIH